MVSPRVEVAVHCTVAAKSAMRHYLHYSYAGAVANRVRLLVQHMVELTAVAAAAGMPAEVGRAGADAAVPDKEVDMAVEVVDTAVAMVDTAVAVVDRSVAALAGRIAPSGTAAMIEKEVVGKPGLN